MAADERDEDELGLPPEGELPTDPDASPRRRLSDAVTRRVRNPKQLSGDAAELLAAFLETSDRAKTEGVKMVAREVRHYLEELKLQEDLYKLMTTHSLEVNMSLRLQPLPGQEGEGAGASEPPEDDPAEEPEDEPSA
jgi:hypothetical protein